MTGEDIVNRALSFHRYVYWYGAKGERCSMELLQRLSRAYPGIYTQSYKDKCLLDIANNKHAIDCSGLVCSAYGITQISTYGMPAIFKQYSGTPKNGMVVWRSNHVGIYNNGYIIEARGIDYDVTTSRMYRAQDWQRIYYMTSVDYSGTLTRSPVDYLRTAIDTINGKYGNGSARQSALEKLGYNYNKLQNIINLAYQEVTK